MVTGRPDCLSYIDVHWEICWEVTVIIWLPHLHKPIEVAFAQGGRNLAGCHYSHLQQRCSAIAEADWNYR